MRHSRCGAGLPGWRNGRRSGLKIRRWQQREGSTPSPGTSPIDRYAANHLAVRRRYPILAIKKRVAHREQGFRPDVIERQLAHMERNEVRAADHCIEYLQDRRQMMQHRADYLGGLAKRWHQSRAPQRLLSTHNSRSQPAGATFDGPQPRRAASMAATSIFSICIIASKARLAAARSGSAIASVRARGVICQDRPHLSLHQPHALSWPPFLTIAFHKRSVSA